MAEAQIYIDGNYTVGAENRTDRKLETATDVVTPKSFMGSIHSLHNCLPALAETSAPLRPLLSRKNEIIWSKECQTAFENLKLQMANIVKLRQFDVHRDICIVRDASHHRLGAVLEKLGPEG